MIHLGLAALEHGPGLGVPKEPLVEAVHHHLQVTLKVLAERSKMEHILFSELDVAFQIIQVGYHRLIIVVLGLLRHIPRRIAL
ncbi:MAG: hypothetical protein AMXMBFR13_17290 [Phycisphaerae bacterium]